jgi:hypothetical protein
MTTLWIIIVLVALAATGLWLKWREKSQREALKQYVLETAELERRLALMNPRLARGMHLEPSEQAWLEKMLYEGRITSDPTKWANPDLGYDAISGTLAEFLATYSASGGSPELLEMKSKQVRVEKWQRMIADIGMPKTQEQIDKWWTEHDGDAKTERHDTVLPGQKIYHAAAIRKPAFQALYNAA